MLTKIDGSPDASFPAHLHNLNLFFSPDSYQNGTLPLKICLSPIQVTFLNPDSTVTFI